MPDSAVRRFRAIVPAEGTHGPQPVWRAGAVLAHCLGLSRPERARIWRHGGVTVNGAPVRAQFVHCFPGDVLEAWYPEPSSGVEPQPELALRVLYEDAWLLAVDKPAGQLSHPARGEQRDTAANAVAARYRNAAALHGAEDSTPGQLSARPEQVPASAAPQPVRLVHRLDRDTSGVLLLARDAGTARVLTRQRAAGSLSRIYLALVAGHPPSAGEITYWLGPDVGHRTRQVAYDAPPAVARASAARTSYQVVQYGRTAALVAAGLHSGRTHQVRAHFAAAGYPLLGDGLYGGPAWPGLRGQALHAWRLRLRHPATGAWLLVEAPLPSAFCTAASAVLRA